MPRKLKPVVAGERVGTKKRDMRWKVGDTVWASKFEYQVYDGIGQQLGSDRVRKCTDEDSLGYSSVVKNAECEKCGFGKVVQRRVFTADLFVVQTPATGWDNKSRGYLVESKGYIRGHQRALLRALVKCHPDVDIRFVIEKDYRVTRTLTFGQWITKYLKKPWVVWTGKLPETWT